MPLNDIEEVLAAHVVRGSTHESLFRASSLNPDRTRKKESPTSSCCRSDGIGSYKLVFEKKNTGMNSGVILALETGVLRATSVSKLLFSSDYADLKFEDIISSFGDDPRFIKISKLEMLDTPITKLASKHGLVSSTCKNTFVNDRCRLPIDLIQSCFPYSCWGKGFVSKQYSYSGHTFQNHSG